MMTPPKGGVKSTKFSVNLSLKTRKLGTSGCCVTFAKTYSAKNLNESWHIKRIFFIR